jgi:hypothetical protein
LDTNTWLWLLVDKLGVHEFCSVPNRETKFYGGALPFASDCSHAVDGALHG